MKLSELYVYIYLKCFQSISRLKSKLNKDFFKITYVGIEYSFRLNSSKYLPNSKSKWLVR